MTVEELATLITAIGGLGGLGGLGALWVAKGGGQATQASVQAAESASEESGVATAARTDVLVQLVVDAERRREAMRRRIIRCPIHECPTLAQMLNDEVAQ